MLIRCTPGQCHNRFQLDFKWVSPDEIDILNVPKDSKLGYILEVDLKYPKELTNKHNLYPLAPVSDG